MPADPSTNRAGPLLVDEKSARALLGNLSAKTMYNLRRLAGLPFVQIGSRVMYRPVDLEAWIARQQKTPAATGAREGA